MSNAERPLPPLSLQQLQSALQADPARASHWHDYLDALIRSGAKEEARRLLELAARRGLDPALVASLSQTLGGATAVIDLAPAAEYATAVGLLRSGRHHQAEISARRLVQQLPNDAGTWTLLGACLRAQGLAEQAIEPMRRALTLTPQSADSHGNLGAVLNEAGHLAEAEEHQRQAVLLRPSSINAHCDLGKTLADSKRPEEALRVYAIALALQPDHLDAQYSTAVLQQALHRDSEAEAGYRHVLARAPDHARALNNLAVLQLDSGRLIDAECSARSALIHVPDDVGLLNTLGSILRAQGQDADAIIAFESALVRDPQHFASLVNLASALSGAERWHDAERAAQRALVLKSDAAEMRSTLAIILRELGRIDEAHQNSHRAQRDGSDLAVVHYNHGLVLESMGRLDDARNSYAHALRLNPTFDKAYSNLLFVLNYHPDQSAEEIYMAYQAYEQQFGLPLRTQWAPHANAPLASGGASSAPRRLRIGYVSPDLRQHSVRHFLEPLLACHDRLRFEVFAYAELAREDAVTERYRSCCDHFILTRGMSDEELASRIRADAIDVLVDVAGHTAGNRLQVFARKPAPVSLSWLGYGYTTGLKAIDYLLTDEASAPAGSEHLFSEAPWRLPGTAYVYRPDPAMGQLSALPALVNGFLTFGTLTRAIRINHRTVRVWAEILQRVPGSRLVIDSKNFQHASMQEAMAERFAQHGIARERLLIGCHSPPWDTLRSIDIGLDCFPHNSGTTLFETLFMGVPYVTLAGRPSVGRLGKSILSGLGKPEWLNAWCATSEQEYIDKAIALASDLTALARIRTELRPQMQRSALMDEAGFARRVEHAYAQMFERWQAQQGPQARHAPPQEARA